LQQYLTVGAVGWEHPQWQDEYYPDGLPDDWRPAYYSNEFHAVLLPQLHWLDGSGKRIQAWVQELPGDFRFFLGVDLAAPELQALDRARIVLQEQLAGIVLQNSQSAPSLAGVPVWTKREGIAPVYNDTAIAVPGMMECWRPDREMSAPSAIGIIHVSDVADLRELRSRMQNFIRQAPPVRDLYLFIDGEPPPPQILRDAVTITELLGY
jgi:hypothetical protein